MSTKEPESAIAKEGDSTVAIGGVEEGQKDTTIVADWPYARGDGINPPGYQFMGPGNQIHDSVNARSPMDFLALMHDLEFTYLEEKGYQGAQQPNTANERFLEVGEELGTPGNRDEWGKPLGLAGINLVQNYNPIGWYKGRVPPEVDNYKSILEWANSSKDVKKAFQNDPEGLNIFKRYILLNREHPEDRKLAARNIAAEIENWYRNEGISEAVNLKENHTMGRPQYKRRFSRFPVKKILFEDTGDTERQKVEAYAREKAVLDPGNVGLYAGPYRVDPPPARKALGLMDRVSKVTYQKQKKSPLESSVHHPNPKGMNGDHTITKDRAQQEHAYIQKNLGRKVAGTTADTLWPKNPEIGDVRFSGKYPHRLARGRGFTAYGGGLSLRKKWKKSTPLYGDVAGGTTAYEGRRLEKLNRRIRDAEYYRRRVIALAQLGRKNVQAAEKDYVASWNVAYHPRAFNERAKKLTADGHSAGLYSVIDPDKGIPNAPRPPLYILRRNYRGYQSGWARSMREGAAGYPAVYRSDELFSGQQRRRYKNLGYYTPVDQGYMDVQ